MNRLRQRYGEMTDIVEIEHVRFNLGKNTGGTPLYHHVIQFCDLPLHVIRRIFGVLEKESSSNHTEFIGILTINTVLLRTTGSVDFGLDALLKPIEVPTGEESIREGAPLLIAQEHLT